jgi:hypothetical protein
MEINHCSGLHINTKMVLERQYAQPSCQNLEVFSQVVKPLLEFKPWLQNKTIVENDNGKVASCTRN